MKTSYQAPVCISWFISVWTSCSLSVWQDLCQEIESLESPVQEATQAGEQLMSHCTDDDKDLVRDKTDKLLKRYNKLRDQANDKRKEAEDAAKLSEDFFDAKDQLIAWCDDTANKLEAAKDESENVQQEMLKVRVQGSFL